MCDLNYLSDLQMETADHDYYDAFYIPTHYIIDRSDNAESDNVMSIPTLRTIQSHKVRDESVEGAEWVDMFGSFIESIIQ